ncbi:MAG: hypothetical protein QX196_04200 [Methylococcaceae bacterium]
MTEEQFKILGAALLVIAYFLSVVVNYLQFRKVSKEVNELKVVVKDTQEIRDALRKPLEGIWNVCGDFSMYHNADERHFTTGEMSFDWNPDKSIYDVLYVYGVQKVNYNDDVITCFSRGILHADYNGFISADQDITIDFVIHSRTAIQEYGSPFTKAFTLNNGKQTKGTTGRIIKVQFVFDSPETKGTISITKC